MEAALMVIGPLILIGGLAIYVQNKIKRMTKDLDKVVEEIEQII